MKKIFLPFLFLSCLLYFSINVFAEVRLPAIIGDHMVLQQNASEEFWGWCDPSETISINSSWDTTTYTTKGNSDGKWSLQVKTPKAGGPFIISIAGSNKILLEDVLVGEVWACSGQSNMEMSYSWGVKEYSTEMENATNQSIHFFHIPRLTAQYPQDDTKAKWVVCNPEAAKRFSLAGYFFGLQVQQNLHVPIGLINASWGGTPAEVWTPTDTIANQPDLKNVADSRKTTVYGPVKAGLAYNAMIYPITRYNIAGVLWYQGEANVGNASTYKPLMTSLIKSWRSEWKKDFPFYYVQIAPFAGYGSSNSSALLREQQTKTLSVPNTGMIVIHDLVNNINDIHPRQKKEVGQRLANLALSETYGVKDLPYKYPMYKSMAIEKNKIRISFTNAGEGLLIKGDTLSGIYIAGDDKVFVPATAKIEGNTIVVYDKNIKTPIAVRLGFTSASMPNLFSKEGLPVNLFRTDDWDEVSTVK